MKLKNKFTKAVKHSAKSKKAQTYEVILQLHTAKGLDKSLQGNYVFWAWKRGHHTGTTLKTAVEAGGATWDDSSINLQCSMFAGKKGKSFDDKILTLSLKENDAAKKKKQSLGKFSINLAEYAMSATTEQFETHFLKLNLLDSKKRTVAKVSATLRVRRDPTGTLYGTSTLSAASRGSLSATDDVEDIDSSFEETEDGEDEEMVPVANKNAKAEANGKADNDANDDDDDNDDKEKADKSPKPRSPRKRKDVAATTSPRSRKQVSKNMTTSPSSRRKTPKTKSKESSNALDSFTPPPDLRRSQSLSNDHIVRRVANAAARSSNSDLDFVSTTSPGTRQRVERHNSDHSSHSTAAPLLSTASSPSPLGSPAHDDEEVRRLTSSLSASPQTIERASPGVPRKGREEGASLTRMESIRSGNLRKYGHRRKGADGVASSPPTVSPVAITAAAAAPTTPSSTESDLLKEKDAELNRLKSELQAKQRADDRRFFVEEAVVFAEVAYADDGLSVSSFVLFRTLLHWDAFESKESRFVASLLDAFDKVLKRNQQDRDTLLYWLGTFASLLHLLRNEPSLISSGGGSATTAAAPNANAGSSTGAGSDGTSESTHDPDGSSTSSVRRGGSPLSQFQRALQDVANQFFARLVALLVDQTDSLLVPAILEGDMNHPERNAVPNSRLLEILSDWHKAASKIHHITQTLVAQLFEAVFDELGVRLVNALLERRDLCSCGNGLQSKMHVSALLQWAHGCGLDISAPLAPILQAADVLVMNKTALLEASTRADVCPDLNPAQLHRLLTIYTPDEYDPDAVHPGVLLQMATLARNSTRPLHRRTTTPRVDLRMGVAEYDVAAAAAHIPAALRKRDGFAFLSIGAHPGVSATSPIDDDDDAPW